MKQGARELVMSENGRLQKICGTAEMPVKGRKGMKLQGIYISHLQWYKPHTAMACLWVERPELPQGFLRGHKRGLTERIKKKKKQNNAQGREGVSQDLFRFLREKRWNRNQKYPVCH